MRVLENCGPQKVFYWFEELCKIPHGSGNIGRISDFLVSFAKERKLEYVQDEAKNVIIRKPASEGMENRKTVILQGHMDMVAVKEPDCDIDMEKDSLSLAVEGDYVYAEGTSLGADDGIAVAYALALLDSDDLAHPPIEVLVTTNEETGMDGAIGVDMSLLKGNTLINIDSEEEGILWAGCAGGMRAGISLPVREKSCDGVMLRVIISGLKGGHSGAEIHLGRGNANVLMGRLLTQLGQVGKFHIVSVEGGSKDNAIAVQSCAELIVSEDSADKILERISSIEKAVRNEYSTKDPELKIEVERLGAVEGKKALRAKDSLRAARLIHSLPYGVQSMSADVEGLVETSLNLGIMKLDDGVFMLEYSLRSSIKTAMEALRDKIASIAGAFGAEISYGSEYPAWEFKKNSALRDTMTNVYRRLYNKEPRIAAIHAGLECGLFMEKKPELDCISIGPDMKDIHTTSERLSISSTQRVWDYIKAVLAEL